MSRFALRPLSLALLSTFACATSATFAADSVVDDVVVTAPRMREALTVRTDPKQPRQPIPAHDGADFLKTIPGFSVIRKGGTDGDPVLRGMAGSRLNILLDGQEIYGGCGGRMDPPTAYVFPESYDRVTVLKGPQTVLAGAGNSAGTVMFERDLKRRSEPGVSAYGSLMVGSFGRHDEVADVRGGNRDFYVQGVATRSHMDDYKDGSGRTIRAAYTRWSTSAALGWTPDDHTRLELSAGRSDGEAAYADRSMDGSRFARDNVALKFSRSNLTPWLAKIDALLYDNYVDHVMDNYTLRPNAGMRMAMNPDRKTTGGKFVATLDLADPTKLAVGVDFKRDIHSGRNGSSMMSGAAADAMYQNKPYVEDMRFAQHGLFGELTHYLDAGSKVVGGLRVDWHEAKDSRDCVNGMSCPTAATMMSPAVPVNNTKGATDRKTLKSGFARYERDLRDGQGSWYLGLGHTERFADYWERGRQDQTTLLSDFLTIKPEKTTQLDAGVNWRSGSAWSGAVSGFYGKVQDYIQIRWLPTPSLARNIDATTWGFESDVSYRFSDTWKGVATVAYVRGENDTDGKPLAQQPPLELRLAAQYDDKVYSWGGLWRLVAAQNRYDIGSGNIVMNGADIGRSSGFSVFSVNAGWKPKKGTQITAGIDNLFDKTYAEHLSRTGAALAGYVVPVNTRINEPGRTFWLKASIALD